MLDTKKVGTTICAFRKKAGHSQEKLAEMLHISPQAISKWENGHTLPETSLLPVLAQIFGCGIDDIIMPAYASIEVDATKIQAEHIADYVVQKLDKLEKTKKPKLTDDVIAGAVAKAHNIFGDYTIQRGSQSKSSGRTSTNITVTAKDKEIKLLEVAYSGKGGEREFDNFVFLNEGHMQAIPNIYHADKDKKIILHEELSDGYIRGFDFDEDNENGAIIRANYNSCLCAVANYHKIFWENFGAFGRVGLPWHFEAKENVLAWIHDAMEKPFKKYRDDEKSGKIPKEWYGQNNAITDAQLDYFDEALKYLKSEYVKLIDTRFYAGKNITVIHGDLHPGQLAISKDGKNVKFLDVKALRVGLCTEDLAMLIALHLAPDAAALPLLGFYYDSLSEGAKDYSCDEFMSDYKLSVAENMFFTIRLINSGIFDYKMRNRAIRAFEFFVLGKK